MLWIFNLILKFDLIFSIRMLANVEQLLRWCWKLNASLIIRTGTEFPPCVWYVASTGRKLSNIWLKLISKLSLMFLLQNLWNAPITGPLELGKWNFYRIFTTDVNKESIKFLWSHTWFKSYGDVKFFCFVAN